MDAGSRRGPAVFHRLRELRSGDRVEIVRVDGGTARFSVTRTVRHSKSGISDSVYRPASGRELRLVTCGGAFDRARGELPGQHHRPRRPTLIMSASGGGITSRPARRRSLKRAA